jgi:hypothetical protein
VEFPKKPERKPYNHTAWEVDMGDMNDIYRGRYGSYYGHSGEDLEYEDAMEIYSTSIFCKFSLMEEDAIQNKSLFHVDGRERVLFDEKLTMELPTYEGKSATFQTTERPRLTCRRETSEPYSRIQYQCPPH